MITRDSDAYRFWIAMWARADGRGVFRADPRRLARAVLGVEASGDVARLLAQLELCQFIEPCPRQRWRGIQLRSHAVEEP